MSDTEREAPEHLHVALDTAWAALAPVDGTGAVQTTAEEDAAVVAELREVAPEDLARAQLSLLLVRALGEHVRMERAGWV